MRRQSIKDILLKKLTLYIIVIIALMVSILTVVTIYEMSDQNLNESESTLGIVEQQLVHNFSLPINELAMVQLFYESGRIGVLQEQFDNNSTLFAYSGVDILDENGIIIDCIPKEPGRMGFDMSRNNGFELIRGSQSESVIGNINFDSSLDEMVLHVGIKAQDTYIVGYFPSVIYSDILEDINVEDGHIAITDEFGSYVAHTEREFVDQRRIDTNIRGINSGTVEYGDNVQYMGEEHILIFKKVEAFSMNILYYQNKSSYQKIISTVVFSASVLLVVFIPIILMVISGVVGQIQTALDQLTGATKTIANGHYNNDFEDIAYNEMYLLMEEFRIMSQEIASREEEISNLNNEVENNYYMTISLMAKAIEAKDQYTGNHCERVKDLAVLIGEGVFLPEDQMKELRYGSILHDIGKLGIPENVLNKPGRLTGEEYELIKEHSQMGYDILGDVPMLEAAKDIILYHHESYDGSGYPAGLKGQDIPLLARIVSIADAFDAMTSKRPYRESVMSNQEAMDEVKRWSNKQFDQELVEIFEKVMLDAKEL